MEPIGQRWILHPGMIGTHVILDLILNDFHPLPVTSSTSLRIVSIVPRCSSTP